MGFTFLEIVSRFLFFCYFLTYKPFLDTNHQCKDVNNQFLLANLDTTFTKRIAIRQTTNLYFTDTERHQKLVHLLVCKMQNDFFCGDNCILHNLKDTFGYQGNIKWHFC